MKTKIFMTALALPLAFAACTNEDVFTSAPGAQGETLTVAVTRGGYDADTRAAWVDEKSGASFEWTTLTNDKIGLALLNPADASKVVTNYEMSLIGWSNANGKGSSTDYGKKAQNGVKYTDNYQTANDDGNAGSGVFQATGLTVMDGDYIVYHPYNKDFAKAGYMAVDFKTVQTADVTTTPTTGAKETLAAAGDNAFSYSLPKTITKGGKVESDFATRNLSALVKLALTEFGGTETLEKIILLEDAKNFNKNSNGFLKSASLNAEKIKTETGINVLESPVYTSMVSLTLKGGVVNLDDANLYMVAGPRTSSNQYSILLINNNNKASIWNAGVNFTAGNKSTINIKYNASHPFNTRIVTDGDDLKTILETPTTYDGETIYILGDLTVENLGTIAAEDITIEAYGENPETTLKFVASGTTTVNLKGVEGTDEVGLKLDVPVTTETKNSGKIVLDGTTSFTNLTNNGTLAINGEDVAIASLNNKKALTISAGAVLNTTGNVSNSGTIEVAAVDNTTATDGGTWNIGEGTTLTNSGEINNFFTINNFGTIDNEDGTYVQKLEGKFIGQYDIAADKRGNYVIEVNSNEQFLYANGTTCTTIRVVQARIEDYTGSGNSRKNILSGLKIEKRVELTGNTTDVSGNQVPMLELENTELNGGLYIINNNTEAVITGTAYASTIVINAASSATAIAPSLTIEANSIIKAGSIVNNGTGSIKEGASGIPADVKTLSSTGRGTWDNYPQVVTEL